MSNYSWEEWKQESLRRGVKSEELALIWYYIEVLQCFPPEVLGEHTIEVFDNTTAESIRVRCSCAFNALVMAIKALNSDHVISIIHDRETDSEVNYTGRCKYNDYALNHSTGMVERTVKYSNMSVYGERDIA